MGKYQIHFIDGKGREFYIPCKTLAEGKRIKRKYIAEGCEYIEIKDITGKFLAMSSLLLAVAFICLVFLFDGFPVVLSLLLVGFLGKEILIRGREA